MASTSPAGSTSQPATSARFPLRTFWGTVLAISAAVVVFLFWLIYFQPVKDTPQPWVGYLPQLNAALNFTSFCLVLAGLRAIFQQRYKQHGILMTCAMAASGLFLVSYLIYHYNAGHSTFEGEGLVRGIYLFILITHIVLSVILVPMLLGTFSLAALRKFSIHRKIAKWTYPVWLYVSATGVAVFLMLRGLG
ncbi:MAG: DUF420 domain-containing protein [Opitutales bacterium]